MRLFIHIPKNGGMTVRRGLSDKIVLASKENHVSSEYSRCVLKVMTAAGEHHGFEHARIVDVSHKLRESLRAFALIRNPWARTVSRYTFARHIGDKAGQQSFREFLDERFIYGGLPYYWHRGVRGWYEQRCYVLDEHGDLAVDCLRLESDDLRRYFNLSQSPRRRNVSNTEHLDYREFYGNEEYDIVKDWYAGDIEFFGFGFDGPATQNIWKPE